MLRKVYKSLPCLHLPFLPDITSLCIFPGSLQFDHLGLPSICGRGQALSHHRQGLDACCPLVLEGSPFSFPFPLTPTILQPSAFQSYYSIFSLPPTLPPIIPISHSTMSLLLFSTQLGDVSPPNCKLYESRELTILCLLPIQGQHSLIYNKVGEQYTYFNQMNEKPHSIPQASQYHTM